MAAEPKPPAGEASSPETSSPEVLDFGALGLPTDGPALVRYLTNSYKGVGRKTSEALVESFGAGLFEVIHREPERLKSVIRADRMDQLLQGWKADLGRRLERLGSGKEPQEDDASVSKPRPGRRTRKSSRSRSGGEGSPPANDPS